MNGINLMVLISFDATALFTPIDPELAKKHMTILLHGLANLAKYTKIEILRIMDFSNLCLTTYFQFNGQIYQQMEPLISGLIVLQHQELLALSCTQPNTFTITTIIKNPAREHTPSTSSKELNS